MRPLRFYLLALVVGAIVPLLAMTAVQTVQTAESQRNSIRTALIETSKSLASAVQHELDRSIAALQVLAASPRLAEGDVAAFHREARDTMAQMGWSTVWLADAQGQQLVNLLSPVGASLPSLGDRPYVAHALRSGSVSVSGLLIGRVSGQPVVTVVVPRLQGGRASYVIGAALSPDRLNDILATLTPHLHTVTASVIDRDYVIVARSPDAQRWTGQRAHADYVRSLAEAPDGFARTTTIDGQRVYAAYRRLPQSGWTVGLGVLASEVEAPLRRALWSNALIGLAMLLLAGIVAALLSRRITVPIKALVLTAGEIARGREVPPAPPSKISEIATLSGALQAAAEATAERNQLAEQARDIAAELEVVEMRERQQIARDLHDDLAQTLSAAQIRLGRLLDHADAKVARIAAEVQDLIARANRSTRSLAEQLSPPVLYELGLVPALEWLAAQFAQDYGLRIRIDSDAEPKPLATEDSSIVFRCVRELLINVAKHAQTAGARVDLRVKDGRQLHIVVSDDGRGIEAAGASGRKDRRRLGLRGIRERIAHLGGSFDITRHAGGGTRASMWVPLAAQA